MLDTCKLCIADFPLPIPAFDAIGSCRSRDEFITVAKALVQNERIRCRTIVQTARETGNDDLRGIIAEIQSGGDEPQMK